MVSKKFHESIHVNNLIALCYVLDDYKEFREHIINFMSRNYDKDLLVLLYKYASGEKGFVPSKVKKFYLDNKKVIDKVNQISSINSFVGANWRGNLKKECNLDLFYEYIQKNRDNLEQILLLLNRIKELGFSQIKFDENITFTDEEYEVYKDFQKNSDVVYLDNMEAVFPCSKDVVVYRTVDSNYKIKVTKLFLGDDFNEHHKNIVLNSLVFDPNRLPEKINKECIFDKIAGLTYDRKKKNTIVYDSATLSAVSSSLTSFFDNINEIVDGLDSVENNEQIKSILKNIRFQLVQLQEVSSEIENNVLNDLDVTKEEFEKAKKKVYQLHGWNKN